MFPLTPCQISTFHTPKKKPKQEKHKHKKLKDVFTWFVMLKKAKKVKSTSGQGLNTAGDCFIFRQHSHVVIAQDCQQPGGSRFTSSSLPPNGFVFGGHKFNSSISCKWPNSQPPSRWDFWEGFGSFYYICFLIYYSHFSTAVFNLTQ